MIVVVVLVVVTAVVGGVVWLVSRAPNRRDPADVRVAPHTVHEVVVGHPALRRLLRRRIDPTAATGLALTLAALLAFVGTLVAGLVLEMVQRNAGLARLDASAARFGVQHLGTNGRRLFRAITELGSTKVIVPLAALVGLAEMRRVPARRVFWFFLVAIGGTVAITNVVKVIVDRARPDIARFVGFSGPSFPSGHSSTAAVAFAAFALVLGRNRRKRVKAVYAAVAAMVAVAVASSRVLLGVHWLTDVIAGLAVGWSWFAVSSIMFGGRVLHFGQPIEEAEEEAAALPPEQPRAAS